MLEGNGGGVTFCERDVVRESHPHLILSCMHMWIFHEYGAWRAMCVCCVCVCVFVFAWGSYVVGASSARLSESVLGLLPDGVLTPWEF